MIDRKQQGKETRNEGQRPKKGEILRYAYGYMGNLPQAEENCEGWRHLQRQSSVSADAVVAAHLVEY